jgi:hypothetical protein
MVVVAAQQPTQILLRAMEDLAVVATDKQLTLRQRPEVLGILPALLLLKEPTAEMAAVLFLVVVAAEHLKPELTEGQLGAREVTARHLLFQALR